MPKAIFTLAALGLAAFAAHPASAQTIINGGFEANSFVNFPGYANLYGNGQIADWSSTLGAGLNPYSGPAQNGDGEGPDPFANNGVVPGAQPGNQIAFLQTGSSGTTSISQTLSGFVFGDQYQISFYDNSRQNYGIPTLSVSLGGQTIVTAQTVTPVGGSNPYHSIISSIYTAPSTADEPLTFAGTYAGTDAAVLLDNISIKDLGPASAAPEPSQVGMLALVAAGLGALVVKARKRKTATSAA